MRNQALGRTILEKKTLAPSKTKKTSKKHRNTNRKNQIKTVGKRKKSPLYVKPSKNREEKNKRKNKKPPRTSKGYHKPVKLSFFKYPGGKTMYVEKMHDFFPPADAFDIYLEPFVGGGSVFFTIPKDKKRVINDLDKNVYEAIKSLKNHGVPRVPEECDMTPNKEKWLEWRDTDITEFPPEQRYCVEKYLRTHAYMGIKRGFDGRRKWSGKNWTREREQRIGMNKILGYKEFIEELMKGAEILNEDYKEVLLDEEHNVEASFAFLDPPYVGEKFKTMYKEEDFSIEEFVDTLTKFRGMFFLTYDYNEEMLKELCIRVRPLHVEIVDKKRTIKGEKYRDRDFFVELYAFNYDPETGRKLPESYVPPVCKVIVDKNK